MQDREAIRVKVAFTTARATAGFFFLKYIGALCKISYERKVVVLKGVENQWNRTGSGITVWMWICNTLLFGVWSGFSFLVCLYVYLNCKI